MYAVTYRGDGIGPIRVVSRHHTLRSAYGARDRAARKAPEGWRYNVWFTRSGRLIYDVQRPGPDPDPRK